MKEIPMRCENCYNYYFEEDADGVRYHYCDIFDCQLCEIAGVDPMTGCELYDQMPTPLHDER